MCRRKEEELGTWFLEDHIYLAASGISVGPSTLGTMVQSPGHLAVV